MFVDEEAIIDQKKGTFKTIKVNHDFNNYILFVLLNRTFLNKEKVDVDNYHSLSSTILQAIFRGYNDHMKLFGQKVINGKKILFRQDYIKSKKCYGYNINKSLISFDVEFIEIKSRKIIKLLKPINENENTNLYPFLDLFSSIQVDSEPFKRDQRPKINSYQEFGKYFSDHIAIASIKNNHFRISRSLNTDGRLHSNFTNTSKALRKYLSINSNNTNNKLIQIDVNASVYRLLYYLFSTNTNKVSNYLNKSYIDINIANHIMLVKNSIKVKTEEIKYFEHLLKEEDFYNSIKEELLGSEYVGRYKERKTFKKDLLSMLMSPNGMYEELESIFEKRFPSIFSFIRAIKSNNNMEQEHKMMSYILFQLEASVMIDLVAMGLINHKNQIKFITIHDCIMVEETYKEFVIELIKNTYKLHLGMDVKLTIE